MPDSNESLNPRLIGERTEALAKAIANHLDLLEQSRAGDEDSRRCADVLKQASARMDRWLALLALNERLNRLREASQTGIAEDDPAISRTTLMRLAVDAGLSLDKAARLISTARDEGRGHAAQSGE